MNTFDIYNIRVTNPSSGEYKLSGNPTDVVDYSGLACKMELPAFLYQYEEFEIIIEQLLENKKVVVINEIVTIDDIESFDIDIYSQSSLIWGFFYDGVSSVLPPGGTYVMYVSAFADGEEYVIENEYDGVFYTENINHEFTPGYALQPGAYPTTRDQGRYGTCVAEALAFGMDYLKLNSEATPEYEENFSSAYIYGSDNDKNGYGMYTDEALNSCVKYGSPRWEILSGYFPDSMEKKDAYNLFKNASKRVEDNAERQSFNKWKRLDFYNSKAIFDFLNQTPQGIVFVDIVIPKNFYEVYGDDDNISELVIPNPNVVEEGNDGDVARHTIAIIGSIRIGGQDYWIIQNSWGEDWGYNGRAYLPFYWGSGVLGAEAIEDYGGAWVCGCYAVTGASYLTIEGHNDFYREPTAAKNLEANIALMGSKDVSLSWDADEEHDYYAVLSRQKGVGKWSLEKWVTDTSADIILGSYGIYEFMVIGMTDSCCSPPSNIYKLEVFGLDDLIPENLTVKKFYRELYFTWEGAETATGFNIRLIRNWDKAVIEKNTALKNCRFEDLDFGVEYTVKIQAYNEFYTGDFCLMDDGVLTYPSPATIDVSTSKVDDEIYVATAIYGVEDTTNATRVELTLTNGDKTKIYETKTIKVAQGEQNPSGSVIFDTDIIPDNRYYVEARIILEYNGDILYGMDSRGNLFRHTSIYIDSSAPDKWEWESPMNEDLEVVMSNTLGCPVVRPITAIEWYKFQQRINEILSYHDRDEYDFYFIPGGLSTDEEADITEFDPDIYNEAVRAIRTLGWITEEELPYINYDTQLSSEIFIRIRDVLNGCI